jgi:predicted transposase YdaD
LIRHFRAEGWLLGKQEGRQEGRQEGEQTVLLRQLTRKFGDLTLAQRRRVQRADSETLLRWPEQVLFAATADEALR